MSEVWVIQHVKCETLGTIADTLEAKDITARTIRVFEGFRDELQEAGIHRSEIVGKASKYLPRLQKIGGFVFQGWADLIAERSKAPDD